MRTFLERLMRRYVVLGRLTVRWPNGDETIYSGGPGPEAAIAIRDRRSIRRLVLNPALGVGEAYMDGMIEPIGGSIYDALDLAACNARAEASRQPVMALHRLLGRLARRLHQFNPAARSRRNVRHHYDLSGRTYSLFLDRDRQYSCGYFATGSESLEAAQAAKKRHVASKLRLDRPDLRVLDIGCGWGGMALTLARDYGARVIGITLSTEQLAEARARAAAAGLSDRVTFELLDYRALRCRYDRIVSVGMFEHVGVGHYQEFFEAVKQSLEPDGVALIHAIGRSDGPAFTNPWFAKYIFPGGYSPALSEVLPAAEKSGLIVTDIEILRLHYAETLRHWRRRFAANRDAIASLHDERFCRMFEFYLAGSEVAFRRGAHMNWQLQLVRHQEALPVTRDYMFDIAWSAAQSSGIPVIHSHAQADGVREPGDRV